MENIVMSREEMKIRRELEIDVERDLEEEIKDGIYHLALRLLRLYQSQREKSGRELCQLGANVQQGTKKKILTEVNINIRMEGGTKIEIKETKKEARENGGPTTSRSENAQEIVAPKRKKFDWAKTLRSGPNTIIGQGKMFKKDLHANENFEAKGLGKSTVPLGQGMGNISIKREQRELGWKD